MNYISHYNALIERAKNRSILPTEYKEIHHIQPRSMGGSDDRENLVDLYPEEHLVAHLLLTKIYPEHEGLLYGAFRMTNYKRLSNKEYGWLRKLFVERMRDKRLGTTMSEETKAKISESTSGKNNAMYGRNHTDEVKKKQSELVKGKVPVIDKKGNKFLISKEDPRWVNGEVTSLTKGRKHIGNFEAHKKIFVCPHCGKEGKGGQMFRWHFDKCKHKK